MIIINCFILLIFLSKISVDCIKVDAEFRLLKKGCYDRIAIGEKLSPGQIYKKFDHKTVSECEKECTNEEDVCRAYSFGIGTKGNGTCLLSKTSIKETANLEPIGTLKDAEFDLYIKKLDCYILLNPQEQENIKQQHAQSPLNNAYAMQEDHHQNKEKYYENLQSSNQNNYGYHYDKPENPQHEEDSEQIHTPVVSVASGPDSFLHPLHNILVSGDMNDYGIPNEPLHVDSSSHNNNNYGNNLKPLSYSSTNYGYGGSQYLNEYNVHYYPDKPIPNYNNYQHEGIDKLSIDRRKYESYNHHQSDIEMNTQIQYRPHEQPNYYYQPQHFYDNDGETSKLNYADKYATNNHYGSSNSYNEYLFMRQPNGLDKTIIRPNNLESNYDKPISPAEPISSTKPPISNLFIPTSTELSKVVNEEGIRIVSENMGSNGGKITSFITELKDACFRRALSGHRTVRSLVRKHSICDTVEQCQQECGNERRFHCEGFNYRLDSTGRGKGECELLDLPLSKLDMRVEIVPDEDCDLYVRDRNAAKNDCRQLTNSGNNNYYYPTRNSGYRADYGYGYGNRPNNYDNPRPRRPPIDRWDGMDGSYLPNPPRRPSPQRPILYDRNGQGEYSYHQSSSSSSHVSHSSSHRYQYNEHNVDRYNYQNDGNRYLPSSVSPSNNARPPIIRIPNSSSHQRIPVIVPLDVKHPNNPIPSYPPDEGIENSRYPISAHLRPSDTWRNDGRHESASYGGQYGYNYNRFGSNNEHKYNIPLRPLKPSLPQDWGRYGGSYGTGTQNLKYHGFGARDIYNYWGLNKLQNDRRVSANLLPPSSDGSYLPLPHNNAEYLPRRDMENNLLPGGGFSRLPNNYNFLKDECSLRSATGFRLYKGIVKKIFSVANIYECELCCFKETDFSCASFSFRYSNLDNIVDNCYLSEINYKELDYYTHLEPDRSFDIYTMNNREKCTDSNTNIGRYDNECFWRVRSGQRLDHSVVRVSLNVKSIIDCQFECLKSKGFTCRAYSFRYGPLIIGRTIENCLLTDCPYYELDPNIHFVNDQGFEIYDRGSYGHGCEPNHFDIPGVIPKKEKEFSVDQLCYLGFGHAAKLLPQATFKSINVPTELDCKSECSKIREKTIIRCMTFSFEANSRRTHNCFLSDILQRDLLLNVDYIEDPNSLLFTWNNYNPQCVHVTSYKPPVHKDPIPPSIEPSEGCRNYGENDLDLWKIYSVNGWACKRGTSCQENIQGGFWYCELEDGAKDSWDYCCRPNHYCGLSNGFSYSWCYVGYSSTQWRKCNDQYYPYNSRRSEICSNKAWQISGAASPSPHNVGFRPDRPNAPRKPEIPQASLDQYEEQFDNEFLAPPKPGGFGQPRRWPVQYIHKELPPNETTTANNEELRKTRINRRENSKISAIKSLINLVQNPEIQNLQYNISNNPNQMDDILYVKIPLPNLEDEPTNRSIEQTTKKSTFLNDVKNSNYSDAVNIDGLSAKEIRAVESPITEKIVNNISISSRPNLQNIRKSRERSPSFRKGIVVRTNVTSSIRKH